MYYIETISPKKRCAQWLELRIYYAHALKRCPPDTLPTMKNLVDAYSHYQSLGMKPQYPFEGRSQVFYFLAPSILAMKRLHLYMYEHNILKCEEGSNVYIQINEWYRTLPTVEELKRPYIEHYAYVHETLNANPKYGLLRQQYFDTAGKDGFIPKRLDFSILFHGIAEIKNDFNHTPIPGGNSKAQVELGLRPHPSITEKLKKNMYAERPDTTFKSLYRKNPHSQYPTERLFEKDLLRLHRRVRARTESNSIHHYVHELGFVFNSADIHHWEEYFVKHTHVRSFERLVAHLDQELHSVQ